MLKDFLGRASPNYFGWSFWWGYISQEYVIPTTLRLVAMREALLNHYVSDLIILINGQLQVK